MVLRVGVLGPVAAWFGGQELSVGQPRQQAVLGILAMRANRVISRGELVDAVWGHDPPASAEGGVYTYVAGLRRIIEPNRSLRGPGRVLVSSGAGYVLHLVPGQPDAVAFEQHLARARQLRKVGDPAAAVAAINAALGLWRGAAFAGVPGPFAETERARLAEMRSAAAEERADVLLSLGRHGEVVPDLTAMVADHPLRERMRGLLMIALYRSGRQAEALRVYAEGRRVLADELGIDPGSDLARVHLQVLTMDVALNVAAPVIRIGADDAAEPGQQDEPQAAADEFAVPADAGYPAESETGHRSWPGAGPRIAEHGPGVPVPAQLPLDAPGFSGRHEELGMLHAMLPSARSASPPRSRCRSSSSPARPGSARPRSRSASAARSPSASRTASCTSTCAASIRSPPHGAGRGAAVLPRQLRRAAAPDRGRPARPRRPCTAACSTGSGC